MTPRDGTTPASSGVKVAGFQLSEAEFDRIRHIVKAQTGISLGLHKRDLVVSRLSRRLRALGHSHFQEYIDYLEGPEGEEEVVNMVNRITTNKTDFYRENHHFQFLQEKLLPALLAHGEATGRRVLKIWSAGCSSGEEPYTLALVLAEFFHNHPGWDYKILATDIDTTILTAASRGEYDAGLLEPVPRNLLTKYFTKQSGGSPAIYKVKPELRQIITFRKFNLMRESYPLKHDIDIIFCRNVMIYFDNDDKMAMVRKFYDVLRPEGHLFVGHSESLMMAKDMFRYVGTTIYQKISRDA